jgi:ribose/xylose/arabinose/galactoside ABC-type transport system permease subunit
MQLALPAAEGNRGCRTGLLLDQRVVLLAFFLLINAFFALQSENFFAVSNYFNVLKACAMIVITGTGATLLMMTSNFDLSTGSNVAFTGVFYTLLASKGVALLPAAALAVGGGVAFGVINGSLVAGFNLPPFIASLGMMYVGRGLALILCNGRSIRDNLPTSIYALAQGQVLEVPIPALFIAFFVAIFVVVERKTLLGKYSLAIGGNRNAAYFSGIPTARIVFLLYVIVGGLAGFSGVLTASRFGAGDPRSGTQFEFDVILAIILGGTSLKGGKGSVLGTLLGALVVAVLDNGLNMLNVLTFWQSILKGAILVLAILGNEKLLARARAANRRPGRPVPAGALG